MKRRVVSGAVMEEGRVKSGLRGGGRGEWSQDSLEKDYYNTKAPKKRKKKRLCECSGSFKHFRGTTLTSW